MSHSPTPPFGQGDWDRTSDLLGPGQARYQLRYTLMVWETGFEPAALCAQGRCSGQAELLPDKEHGGAGGIRTLGTTMAVQRVSNPPP